MFANFTLDGLTPLAIVTALYGWQTVIFLFQNQWAGAIIFAGYAFANIGLMWKLLP